MQQRATQDSDLSRWAAGLIVFVCMTGIFVYTKSVLVPLTIALFLFALASHSMDFLTLRFKLPPTFALLLVIGGSFLGTAVLTLFIVNSFQDFFLRAQEYQDKLSASMLSLQSQLDLWGLKVNLASFPTMIKSLPVMDWVRDFSSSLMTVVGQLLLVLVFFMFLMFGESENKSTYGELWIKIREQINRYILIKVAASILTAFLVFVLLSFCNVELAFPLGVIAGILNFIPNIGAALSVLLPVPLAFLSHGFGWQFLTVLIGGGILQFLIGNFLETKLLKNSIDLNPIAVLLFLLFWGIVWGIAGMFLAIPIMVTVKIVFSRIKGGQWVAALLSGRF